MKPAVVASVVSGSDPKNIVGMLSSLVTNSSDTYELQVVAIINGPDAAARAAVDELVTRNGWNDIVELRTNDRPLGFAANHNRVMRDRSADYYLISNDDIVVHDGALATLVAFLESPTESDVGVASPKLLNPDGSMQPSTFSFPSWFRAFVSVSGLKRSRMVASAFRWIGTRLSRYGDGRSLYWSHDRQVYVDSVAGAFVLVRAAAVAAVGVMDEVALVGREELEWHRRMAEHGWRVAYVPDAAVTHVGSATVSLRPELELEYAKGTFNYVDKHHPRWEARALRMLTVIAFAVRWCIARARRDPRASETAAKTLAVALHGRKAATTDDPL